MKKLITVGFVLLFFAFFAFIYYGVTDTQQEEILKKEIEALEKLDPTKDQYLLPIKTTGDHAVVEESIKNFMNDYATTLQECLTLIRDDAIENALTIDNFKADGKDFVKTKAKLTSIQEDLYSHLSKLTKMTSERSIMSYIEEKNLTPYYNDLYRDLTLGDSNDGKFASAREELEQSQEKIQDLITLELKILNFLSRNSNSWYVENNTILFTDNATLEQYQAFLGQLQSLFPKK